MIMAGEGIFPLMEKDKPPDTARINALKVKIHDEAYLCEAIQRIAQVLSNEITGTSGGVVHERKRRQ
ncbi:MAG: hypothetical protein LBD31_02710 [Treponema sp.]|jgi:hypothetical protein|nr:hypothetical protein [Treponema sp.]